MDAPLKELTKLEKLVSNSSAAKGKSPSISDSLESLLLSLKDAKQRIQAGADAGEVCAGLSRTVDNTKKDVDDRQKEIYNSLARFGKALDKRFTTPLPSYSPLFSSPESKAALERTIAQHFLRTGQFRTAEVFIEESGIDISPDMREHFAELHRIMSSLKENDIGPALEWTERNRQFLSSRSSPLEFHLHRSQYIRLLLSSDYNAALIYARANFKSFYGTHSSEILRLMNCLAYLPPSRLQGSPYADLTSPSLHTDLEPMFAKEYCASLGMSRQVPLRVIGDIGGGGALARIEKGRKVMRERKSEWSQSDELPIEIPLGPENRYHSIFACPVSKEQSTEQNPPMMMVCGHVVTRDSLQKLSKAGGNVKCPYCPQESLASNALRVYF
ncbi:CTLH/CRA C-terminal to lish motif domain-containing protein [Cristinia sonorae]|uniref:GID complex catalytic subunit 2 n=1 Tax=Cristinia sonorae TaxID=1940300 RepID=A0A8K0XU04_9AGAR|nr:CTLH/CRA C-terminal to lish motif domain-containing protein [Cristinia sonorae]